MNRMYKIGTRRVDEGGLERIYITLDELRQAHIYDYNCYIALTCCMEELTKRSKRLKALVERSEHE